MTGPAVIAVTTAVIAGCGGSQADRNDAASCPEGGCTIEVVEDVPYSDDALLDIVAPAEFGPWPVLVTVHGAGVDRKTLAPLAEALAEEGAVVYNVSLPVEPPFLDDVEHLACAIRYARGTADDHAGDGRYITVVGYSFGAYVGALVTLSGDDHSHEGCAVDDGSGSADALVGYEGPYGAALNDVCDVPLAALEQSDPELWSQINPYEQVGGNPEAVFRLLHGVDDDQECFDILPQITREFVSALGDAGYDAAVNMIDGAPHAPLVPQSPQWIPIVEQTMDVSAR